MNKKSKIIATITALSTAGLIAGATMVSASPQSYSNTNNNTIEFAQAGPGHHSKPWKHKRFKRGKWKKRGKWGRRGRRGMKKFRRLIHRTAKLQAKLRASLTPTQKAKLKALRAQSKAALMPLKQKLILERGAMKQAMLADTLNFATLKGHLLTIHNLRGKLKATKRANGQKAKALFTPEQLKLKKKLSRHKRKLKKLVKRRMKRSLKRRMKRRKMKKMKANGAFAQLKAKHSLFASLSPAQINMYNKLKLQTVRKVMSLRTKLQLQRQVLKSLRKGPNKNITALQAQRNAMKKTKLAIRLARLNKLVAFHNTLNADQKVKHSLMMMKRWKKRARLMKKAKRLGKRLKKLVRVKSRRIAKRMNKAPLSPSQTL